MARMKKVSIDNAEFTISALTFKQVENWAASREEFPKTETGDIDLSQVTQVQLRESSFKNVIIPSLNNPIKEEADKWTLDKVYDEMDRITYEFLFNEIMQFIGFVVPTGGTESGDAIKGEKPAAS